MLFESIFGLEKSNADRFYFRDIGNWFNGFTIGECTLENRHSLFRVRRPLSENTCSWDGN